jgi:hypothetical protein
MGRTLGILALLAGLAVFCPSPAQASPLLWGRTVEYQYLFPDINSNYLNASNGNYLVGPGVEVANVSDQQATLDLSDTNLFVDYLFFTGYWVDTSFNGFRITDIFGQIPAFAGVTINPATNMSGFDASRISFDADHIWVNWHGLNFDANTIVSLDVNSNAVPDPGSSLLLLGMSLAGLRAWKRRLG